ncbi:hypothetical protein N431DRAFT_439176 [Stipitochalara longipes BDJ]|nr:hypothetical protein N431DRAFT_439176 [Stipitochalara longipes BDJ]
MPTGIPMIQKSLTPCQTLSPSRSRSFHLYLLQPTTWGMLLASLLIDIALCRALSSIQ